MSLSLSVQVTINTLRCRWSKIINKKSIVQIGWSKSAANRDSVTPLDSDWKVLNQKRCWLGVAKVSRKSFAKRFHERESVDTKNSNSFNGNANKNMKAEQICILHSLEVLSFGCNPASRVNSKTPVRLSKGVRTINVPHQRFSRWSGSNCMWRISKKCSSGFPFTTHRQHIASSSFVLASSNSSARIEKWTLSQA